MLTYVLSCCIQEVASIFVSTDICCYLLGTKVSANDNPKVSEPFIVPNHMYMDAPYGLNGRFVDEINRHQSSWKAGVYEEYQNYTINDMIQRAGGRKGLPRVYPRLIFFLLHINKYTFL